RGGVHRPAPRPRQEKAVSHMPGSKGGRAGAARPAHLDVGPTDVYPRVATPRRPPPPSPVTQGSEAEGSPEGRKRHSAPPPPLPASRPPPFPPSGRPSPPTTAPTTPARAPTGPIRPGMRAPTSGRRR